MSAEPRTKRILALVASPQSFVPAAYYDPDGDFLEFFISPEPFVGSRLSKWVTVYHGRESREVVGSCIKDVRKLLTEYPGLDIEVDGGEVFISHMLRAPAWSEGDLVKLQSYKAIIEKAERFKLRAMVRPVGAGS